jgi:hypothetical protein
MIQALGHNATTKSLPWADVAQDPIYSTVLQGEDLHCWEHGALRRPSP